MKKSKANKPSSIHIKKLKNLYLDGDKPAIPNHIYIDELENLHMGNIELATTTSHDESPTTEPVQPSRPRLTNSQLVLVCYFILLSWDVRFRINVDLADVARFIHALTGIPYKNLDNSEYLQEATTCT